MKIEKVNDNKIKVMFNSLELEENNISVHSFLANSFESQKLFLAILDIANEEFGFNIENCKISCETISFNNKNFVTIVTKSNIKSKLNSNLPYNLLDFADLQNDSISNELNISIHLTNTLIYKFNNMEEVTAFCNYFYHNFSSIVVPSSLYQYNDSLFLKIDTKNIPNEKLQNIISILSEFETNLSISELTILKLEEYSKLIIKNSAIETLNK